jgi:hypothetical protein
MIAEGTVLYRVLCRAASATRVVKVAGLNVAQLLAGLVHTGLASDLRQLKDNALAKSTAEARIANADATKRVQEAAALANQNIMNEVTRDAERRKRDAEARIAEAQAAKAELEVEEARVLLEQRREIAAVALKEALRDFRKAGGEIFVNVHEVKRLEARAAAMDAPPEAEASEIVAPPAPAGGEGPIVSAEEKPLPTRTHRKV